MNLFESLKYTSDIVYLFIPFIFILGISIGSFINVLVDRTLAGRSLMGRSSCDSCHKHLAPKDLIPIASFFFLRGKCAYCRVSLTYQYPLVEAITGICFVAIYILMPYLRPVELVLWWGIVIGLIAIAVSDIKTHLIPDSFQATTLVFGLLYHIVRGVTLIELVGCILSGIVVAAPLFFLFLITKKRGMGFGDVELAFVLGVILGVKGGLVMLYLAFLIGSLVSVALLILRKKKAKSSIAFGPFIIVGAAVYLAFQSPIHALIYSLYGI